MATRRRPRTKADAALLELPRRDLILGLGNPGERYQFTRHNRGRDVVTELSRRRGWELSEERCGSLLAYDETLLLAVPEIFMNRSGLAARCLMETEHLDPRHILVVYDDVSLPIGSLRMRARGGPAGQKGMASVIENLQTDAIARLRLGIQPVGREVPAPDLVDFVLSPFAETEKSLAESQIARAADACEHWLREGVSSTMNAFNSTTRSEEEGSGVS